MTYKLEFLAGNVGNIHIMGRWTKIFELLASKDVNGNEMNFGVAMLAGFRGGHFDNLAGAVLDTDVTVLPQSRALHRIGHGSASIGGVEGVFMLSKDQYQS
jgi:hypothetical protein